MYLFKKNTIDLIKIKINLLLILSILFFSTNIYAEEKFVGFIESLDGKAFKNDNGKKIKLNVFDQIFVGSEIVIESNSNATISFLDNSIFTLSSDSTFVVKNFDNLSQNPEFIILFNKGNFTFESGTIAKNKNGNMKINISEMEVALNGTLITGSNSDEEQQVSLVEDSMGRVGTLSVTVGDQTTTITDPSKGISLSGNNEIEEISLSEEETNQVKKFIKEVTVDAQTDTEEDINRAVAKQLAAGTIPDANGDGISDLTDLDLYKAQLYEFKGSRMGYYMEMSAGNDMGLMSDMIRYSDPSQSMQLMQGMMDYDPANAALMMNEVSKEGFDIFSHMNNAENISENMIYSGGDANFEDVRAALVSGMMLDTSEEAIDTMARVMAVSDPSMSSYLVNEITNFEGNDLDNNLSINVLASFTEMAPDKMDIYMQADPSMMSNFTQSAFQNANEGDAEMIADMMQQTSGKNSAYLMSSMMENNSEMITTVYENLAEEEFDIFNHIESAKNDPTMMSVTDPLIPTPVDEPLFFTPENDPFLPLPDTDVVFTPSENQANVMTSETNFYDDLKGQIFSEIINNSDQTASEVTAELMMNSEGDSAMFMMETMMEINPEIIGNVMQNFVEDDFDIFDHFEDTNIIEPTDDIALENPEDTVVSTIKLTKAERKAERQRIKAEKKAERQRIKAERKAERKAARLAAKQAAQEIGISTPIETNPDLQEFKTEVFQDMMTYSDEDTMGTMAQLVATSDESTASLIFETVVTEQQNMSIDGAVPTNNFALDLMNNLSSVDSSVVNTMYETQGDLVNDMMATALSDVTSEDSTAIANIISSSGNDSMNEMVFNNLASSNDQSLTSNVFTTLADSETGAEAIISIASTNQSLYENMAQDVDPAYMTAASLYTNTAAEYNTSATAATAADDSDTTTYAAGAISWVTYPTSPGTISTSTYVSISGTATSMNGVNYSASDLPDGLTIDYTSGLIFGTPTSAGSWNSTITATDMMDFNSFATASLPFEIIEDNSGGYNAGGGGSFSFTSTPYAPATLTVNSPITAIYLYTTGGVGNITWSATNLPMGLSITAGQISGTPDTVQATSSAVNITATDENGNTATTSLTFPQVDASGGGGGGNQYGPVWASYVYGPTILTQNSPMADMFLDAAGTGPLSFTASNLPPGLYVDGSYIKGTPTTQTDYSSSVMITASDNNGSQTKYVTFPQVDASGGGGGVTWNTTAADFSSLTLTQGSPMSSITLSATGSGTISYADDAMLPAGISLVAGVVSGTPSSSTSTETSVTFVATDSNGDSETLTVSFPIINASGGGGSVTWTTTQADFPSTMTKGTAISSITLSATGSGTISYADDAMLPAGISLVAGVVSGTPSSSTSTETSVTFVATDSNGDSETLTVSFPIINAASGISNPNWITTPTTSGTYTTSSNISISAEAVSVPAANGVIYSASSLPPGVTLDTATGLISGTPTTAGTYNSEIKVEDATDSTFQITEALTFSVTGSGGVTWITLDTDFPSTLTENDAISSITLDATGTGAITYTYTGTLPPGLFLTANVLSGTPTTSSATSTTITFTATDAAFNTEDLVVTFPQVASAETIDFTTAEALTSASSGENISRTIQATGSQGSFPTYAFISISNTGNADTSLATTPFTLTGNIISGIAPRLLNAATYSFGIQASINAGAITNNKTFTLLISEDATCISPTNNICT